MGRLIGATERDLWRSVILPGAAPFIVAGIRIAVPYAFGSAVVAELLSANRGLGYIVQFSASSFDAAGVFAALAGLASIVLAIESALRVLERRLLPWRHQHAGDAP
jgi:NitT/TauT family transport system permease protein